MKKFLIQSTYTLIPMLVLLTLHANTVGAASPTDPMLSAYSATSTVGASYSVSFTSTDSDGNDLQYHIDWNNDGVTDAYSPEWGYVASGVTQTESYTWNSAGTKIFKVRAIDNTGNDSGWVSVSVVIDYAAPLITTNAASKIASSSSLLAMTGSYNGYMLNGTFNANGNVASGWIRYSTTSPGTCNNTFGKRIDGVSTLVTGGVYTPVGFGLPLYNVAWGTTYYFCALASSTSATVYGALRSFTTSPSTPTGLSAVTNATCNSGQINLSWNPSPSAYCYRIEVDGVEYCNGNSTTYVSTGLINSSLHSYRVRAYNGTYSEWTPFVYATAPSSCGVADVLSQSLFVSAGPYTVGQSVSLSAQVRNGGGANTGVAFNDNFSYSYISATGPWTNLALLPKSSLAIGATSNDMQSFTLPQSGTIYVQHCVDSNNDVNELSGETPNCSVSSGLTVLPAPTGNVLANPASLNGGGTSTISWNSSSAGSCVVSSIDVGNTDTWTALSSSGEISSPLYGGTTYTLVCDGVAVSAVPISVTNIPELTLTSRVVESGTQTMINWNTHNGDEGACTLSGGQYADLIPSTSGDPNIGSVTLTVNAMTTYTLTCPSGGDVITAEVVPVGFEQ